MESTAYRGELDLKLIRRSYQTENDYCRLRNLLLQVYLLDGSHEHSRDVARLHYRRWHFILNCKSNSRTWR